MQNQNNNATNPNAYDEEHDDDAPVGRVFTRKEALGLLAGLSGAYAVAVATGAAAVNAAAPPKPAAGGKRSGGSRLAPSPSPALPGGGCVAKPEQTEGPFFVDEKLNRSDIRADAATGARRAGVPLTLTLYVANVTDACKPIAGALVDIWHCDAAGLYSDVRQQGTQGANFLRGYQTTDANGKATFTTIFPGWYPGRTVHIHLKVRSATGQQWEFTSQLYFDDVTSDAVFAKEPYASQGARRGRNRNDGLYSKEMQVPLTASGTGYAGAFTIGLVV